MLLGDRDHHAGRADPHGIEHGVQVALFGQSMPGLELLGIEERSNQFVGDCRHRAISRGAGDFDRLAPFGLPLREQGGDECLPLLFGEAQLLIEEDHERVDAGGPLVRAAFLDLGAIASGLASREVTGHRVGQAVPEDFARDSQSLERFGEAPLEVVSDFSDLIEWRRADFADEGHFDFELHHEGTRRLLSLNQLDAPPSLSSGDVECPNSREVACPLILRRDKPLRLDVDFWIGDPIELPAKRADCRIGGEWESVCLVSRRHVRGLPYGWSGEARRFAGRRENPQSRRARKLRAREWIASVPATGSSNPPEKPRRAASRDDSSRC